MVRVTAGQRTGRTGEQQRRRVADGASVVAEAVRPAAITVHPRGERVEHADHKDRRRTSPWGPSGAGPWPPRCRSSRPRSRGRQRSRRGCRCDGLPVNTVSAWNGAVFNPSAPPCADDDDVEDDHDEVLGDDEDGQHLGRQVDPAVPEHRDERQRGIRVGPPGQLDAELGEQPGAGHAEQPVQPDLHAVVAQQGDQPGRAAGGLAEADRGEGVEAAGVSHVACHRGVAGREDEQQHRDEGEQARHTGAVAQQHADRDASGEGRERGRSRHDEEDDEPHAERASAQLVGRGPRRPVTRPPRPGATDSVMAGSSPAR